MSERITALEFSDDGWAEFCRDWFGHVEPALERVKDLMLSASPTREGT